jgi:hypothetical protein
MKVNLPESNPESNEGSWARDRQTMEKAINRRRHSGKWEKQDKFF